MEKDIQKRLQNLNIPESNLDEQSLWDSIEEELDQSQPEKAWPFPPKWYLFGALILFLSGTASYFAYNYSNASKNTVEYSAQSILAEQKNSTKSKNLISDSPLKESITASNEEITETVKATIDLDRNHNSEKKTIEENNLKTPITKNLKSNRKSNTIKNKKEKVISNQEIQKQSIEFPSDKNKSVNMTSIVKTRSGIQSTPNLKDRANEYIVENPTINTFKVLKNIKEQTVEFVSSETSPNLSIVEIIPLIKRNVSINKQEMRTIPELSQISPINRNANRINKLNFYSGFSSGLNLTNTNFSPINGFEDYVQDKNKFTEAFYGSNYNLTFGSVLNDQLFIETGISLNDLWLKLNINRTDTIQILKSNVVNQVWIDTETGDTIKSQIGDLMVDAIVNQEVIHFNNLRTISIPLIAGYTNGGEHLKYKIGIGPIINVAIKQEGRTFDINNELIQIQDQPAYQYMNDISIGLTSRFELSYAFNDKIALAISPQWIWQRNLNYADESIKLNIHQYQLNLGINYSF